MSLIRKNAVGGIDVAQIDECGGGVGNLSVADINKNLDAWLAKREGKDVTTWTQRHYGNRGKKKS